MPLPPLLLERLKRRKIIKVDEEDKSIQQTSNEAEEREQQDNTILRSEEEEEEIIAEDYSDDDGSSNADDDDINDFEKDNCESKESNLNLERRDDSNTDCPNPGGQLSLGSSESVLGCPNKYNVYHDCSQHCIDNYSNPKSLSPTIEQRKQLALLLKTYPMSNEWTVVYDPGVRTFYFWNIITNLVSWFPPAMNGFISLPANQIRQSMKETELS